MTVPANWPADQAWESSWWGDCINTYQEEQKQLECATRMGLTAISRDGRWPVYDLKGVSVLDVGGGPVSMLLKTVNRGLCRVVDPCAYPDWVARRYLAAGIDVRQQPAEDYDDPQVFDEAWIYNCLQHVQDPQAVLAAIRPRVHLIRLFEWLDVPAQIGHPHVLTEVSMNAWLGDEGFVHQRSTTGWLGRSYSGVFLGHATVTR